MKIAYVLVGILVLVGVYFLLAPESQAPTANENRETENLPTDPDAENRESTDSPEAEPGDTALPDSTDAGMEFPTIEGEAEVSVDANAKVFTVDSFGFGYAPNVIRVSEGDTVTINLTNSGGLHDWVIDEFDAATERIGEGDTTSVTFVADRSGEFEFYCSVGNHRERGMVGTLIVE